MTRIFVLMHKYQDKLSTNPSLDLCGIRNDQCPVPYTPLSTRYNNSENYHSYNNILSIVFTLKPTSLTSLLTHIHLMKHNKRQYKPHLKWGDLYIRLNPSVDYLRGPPYFGSRREYQFIALISLVDAFYSDIEVEIEIRPDPLPHVASFLSLVRRPFQGSGIHLTLAECFHLNRFIDYIIIRGTLEPVKNPGWIWYPNSLANMQHRKSSSRVLEKI